MKLSKLSSYPIFDYKEFSIPSILDYKHSLVLSEIQTAKLQKLKMPLNSDLIDFIEELISYEKILEEKDFQYIDKFFRENQNILPLDEIKSKYNSYDFLIHIISKATFIQNLKGIALNEKKNQISKEKYYKNDNLQKIKSTKNKQEERGSKARGKLYEPNKINNNILQNEEIKNNPSSSVNHSSIKKDSKPNTRSLEDFFKKQNKIQIQPKATLENSSFKNEMRVHPKENPDLNSDISQKRNDNFRATDESKRKEEIIWKPIKHAYGNFVWGIIDQPESIQIIGNNGPFSKQNIVSNPPEVAYTIIERIVDSNYIKIHIPNLCNQFQSSLLDQKTTERRK